LNWEPGQTSEVAACRGKSRHATVLSVVDAMVYMTLSISSYHHHIDHSASSTTTSSSGENVNWRESAPAVTTIDGRRCYDGGDSNDAVVVVWRAWRRIASASADRQTHKHSRQRHRADTGPVKIDEEGHLIYKDGDILFERCTQQHSSFLRSRNVATLASFSALHCTGTNRCFTVYQFKTFFLLQSDIWSLYTLVTGVRSTSESYQIYNEKKNFSCHFLNNFILCTVS